MSRITKSEILEQNRQMMNILVQIHRLTAPIVDLMASQENEASQSVESPKNATTDSTVKKTKSATNKNGSKSNSPKPEQTANRQAVKRRLHTSDATENANSSTNTSPSSKTGGDDEFLGYLKLQKVSKSGDGQSRSNRKSASSESDEPVLHILKIPQVVLNRLTPEQIIKARQRQSVQLKMLDRREDRRQLPYRKAAPTSLKEPMLD